MRASMAVMATLATAVPATAQLHTAPPVPATAAMTPTDPARLAEARLVIVKLLPPGVYRTVMGSALTPLLGNMADSLKALPLKQLAVMGGLDAKQAAALDKVNLDQVLAIYDPHWRERSQLTMRAMFDAMGSFFTTMEPELREAYAQAYAHQFSLQELRDLDAFLTTPSGATYAAHYMTLASDPAVVAEMQSIMPKMIAQMPAFLAAGQKAAAALPPPRTIESLTPAEKSQLAKALGVREDQLKNPKGTL